MARQRSIPPSLAHLEEALTVLFCLIDDAYTLLNPHVERYYEKDRYCARIMSFVVGSGHRGRGVGRALISAAEDWARQRGARDIMLTTHKRRAGAHRFYRSVGYEATGYRFPREL